MNNFFKFTIGSFVGTILAFFALIIFGSLIIGALSSSPGQTQLDKEGILELDLGMTVSDRGSSTDPLSFLPGYDDKAISLMDMVNAIRIAKDNTKIKGIFIRTGALGTGLATIEELRKALQDFKESGKFIISFGESYTQGAYYLCSLSDKILLNPQGTVGWKGIASSTLYLKEAMEKLGIGVQVYKAGIYKAAVEPYTSSTMSDENRTQLAEYLNTAWEVICKDVSQSRGIGVRRLNELADSLVNSWPAQETIRCRLVDSTAYEADAVTLAEHYMAKEGQKWNFYDVNDLVNTPQKPTKDQKEYGVALYYAEGEISESGASVSMEEGIDSNQMVKDLMELKDKDDVKAVVIRVNSPGGSAYGSEQIWEAVRRLKEKKPVVVSMGDYAASGGYYISCGADSIFTDPCTLTGSIGVFGMRPDISGLLDKVGLHYEYVSTNRHSLYGEYVHSADDEENQLVQKDVDRVYDLFLQRCAEGRKMSKQQVDQIAQGRIWSGVRATEIGLADKTGTLKDAIRSAMAMADIKGCHLQVMPRKKSVFDLLLDGKLGTALKVKALGDKTNAVVRDLEYVMSAIHREQIQARMPFNIRIK